MEIRVEIYDPTSKTFWQTGNITETAGRADPTATLLHDGRVLVTGGLNAVGSSATTDIYDPISGTFSKGPNMSTSRFSHTAILLSDGRVLIAGEANSGKLTAEFFDPTTNVFSQALDIIADFTTVFVGVRFKDGRAFIVGSNITELYDPSGNIFRVFNLIGIRSRCHQPSNARKPKLVKSAAEISSNYGVLS